MAEFKAEEVWQALQQMHPTKAPGPDGMSPIFYQKYWDVVGYDVVNCVLGALNSGLLPCSLNETFMSYIKGSFPIENFRVQIDKLVQCSV